ncbi:enoyl-CoA hydratase [Reinekea marinisedimentorum]|uniref:Enoyl-CoA hydratase/carnithine racemase n=1 Tax=Reinekea marinisedimentorum TaxID=230495 RepID=A0A4R3I8I5_9GAMM|nr:enoyl-CoA hydratase [Reinekea marinisedimentorum]TCS41609.1 enoyl-CoA hydratase/carnithine racemase [Reinekea marinisedimentorum]
MNEILTRVDDGVLEMLFNRPEKKNAINAAMYERMAEILVDARKNPDVAVVLITGKGASFTAGNDLVDFMQNPPLDDESSVFRFLQTMADFPKPVVAAVKGHAVGIGTTLLLHCDIVICGESASFQMPFVNLGLVPEFASSYLLPLRVGHSKAAEWLMTGKVFDAFEAKAAGLINEVLKDEQYFSAARQKAHTLAKQPRESLQITKRLLKQPYMAKTLQTIEEEGDLFRKRLQSKECQQALQRFFARG